MGIPGLDGISSAPSVDAPSVSGAPCVGSQARAVDAAGWIVGRVERDDRTHVAVRWKDGIGLELGTLGGRSSEALGVDPRGWVVGTSQTADGEEHGFLWRDGGMRDLWPLESAVAIDGSGRIAGLRTGPEGEKQAVLWEEGEVLELGNLGGGGPSVPIRMNAAGTVVGMSPDAADRMTAFVWERGEMRALEGLGGASIAMDVDDAGRIVGMSGDQAGTWHAVVWESGRVRDLGAFGTDRAHAIAIDGGGRIVVNAASSGDPDRGRVFLLDGNVTTEIELPAGGLGLRSAADIAADVGVVGVSGRRAFVWTSGAGRLLPFPRSCGEVPADRDGDGVDEMVDRCPRTAHGVVVDEAGCAVDTDGDQVPDGLDACAATPRGVFVDVDGCPIPE